MDAISQTARPNWFARNWVWFVPVGCFTFLLAIAGFAALIFSLVFGMMKSSDAYKGAVERAKADPAVIAALGTPISEGFFTSGNINVSGPAGNANLSIPISGPKGKGTIYVNAHKSAGEWTYSALVVEIAATHERIDLLRSKSR